MQVTTESLAPYRGGQMEIQNQVDGYIFRGEVESILVDDGAVKVRFAWLAEGKGYPPAPNKWVKHDDLDYEMGLEIYAVSDIGPSPSGGSARLCFHSPIVGEMVVLFPPDGSKMDRSRVEGL